MEAGRSLLVGIDLCDDMAQISYYDKKIYEPVPVGIPVGDKYIYEIPSALLVNPNTNEWLWKTKENMQLGGYTLISNLLSKIKKVKSSRREVTFLRRKMLSKNSW